MDSSGRWGCNSCNSRAELRAGTFAPRTWASFVIPFTSERMAPASHTSRDFALDVSVCSQKGMVSANDFVGASQTGRWTLESNSLNFAAHEVVRRSSGESLKNIERPRS